LIILFISLKILNILYQTVIFWVSLVFRVLFWGSFVALGFWVWNRGIDGVINDAQTIATDWKGQYDYFQEQADLARAWQETQGGRKQGNTWWR